jgi:hypothetical protein
MRVHRLRALPLRHGLLPGIIRPRQAEGLSQRRRDPGVAFGVHVETVLAPESRVGADRVCGKVDEAGAGGSSGLADGVIHGPDPGSQETADRHDAGEVRERESQHDCFPADERPHHALEFCPQPTKNKHLTAKTSGGRVQTFYE